MTIFGDSLTFQRPDGQVLGFAHYGDYNGWVVFYFHGLPSSRLEGAILNEAGIKAQVHIIAVDRPGVGLSTPQHKRTLLSWPQIVSELAAHLKVEQFYVLGTSAGGPYALACARELTEPALRGVGVVAGMCPVKLGLGGMTFGSKLAIYATQTIPWLGKKMYEWLVIPAAQNPDPAVFEKLVLDGLTSLDESDKNLLKDDKLRKALVDAAREHFRQGSEGLLDEWRLFVAEWGFELEDIRSDKIRLWCGQKDLVCPADLSRRMASRIGCAELTEFPEATHYSLLVVHGEQILRALTAEGSALANSPEHSSLVKT